MATVGELIVKVKADLTNLSKNLNQAQSKLLKTSKQFKSIGADLSKKVTLPILAIGGVSVKVAADFEQSMNRVKALTGATGEDFEKLEERARELGETTQYSASQAANAMGFFAQAGFDATKIYDVLPDTLNLAASANLDLAQSADIVSNIMAGYGIEADQLGETVDILAKQFTSSNTDLSQLGEGFKFVGAVAKGLGTTFEETSAALGILSDAGLQGSVAGTGLRRVLSTLATESEKLGIQTTDAAGKLRPLADIMTDLEEKGLTTAEAMEIFGQRGGVAISTLLQQGSDTLRDYTERLSDVGGTAEEIANIQMEGLTGSMKRLKSAAEEAAISFTENILPALTKIVEKIAAAFRAFGNLDEKTKNFIITAGLAAAAVGPITTALGSVIGAVSKLSVLLATNPLLLIATAAGIAAIGVSKLYKNSTSLKDETKKLNDITIELKDTSNEYKEVTKKLEENTGDLTAAEKSLLKIRKEQLKIELIKNFKKINEQVKQNTKKIRENNQAANDQLVKKLKLEKRLKNLNKQYETYNNELDKNKKRQSEILLLLKNGNLNDKEKIKLQNEYRNLVTKETQLQTKLLDVKTYLNSLSEDYQDSQKKENKLRQEALELQTAQQKAIKEAAQLIADGILTFEELGLVNENIKNQIKAQVKAIKEQKKEIKENNENIKENTKAKEENNKKNKENAETTAEYEEYIKLLNDALGTNTEETEENTEETEENTEAKRELAENVNAAAEARERESEAALIATEKQAEQLTLLDKLKKAYKDYSSYVSQGIADISTIFNQSYDNQLTKQDNLYKKEKNRIDKLLENEALSKAQKEQYQNDLLKLEEQNAEKVAKIKTKQFKAQKAAAVTQSIWDTLTAVTKTFSQFGFPAGLIPAAAMGTLGAVKTAAIAAEPIPQFADGGVVKAATVAMVGEGRDSEAILPLNNNTYSELGQAIARALPAQQGQTSVVNNFNSMFADKKTLTEFARVLYPVLKKEEMRLGI